MENSLFKELNSQKKPQKPLKTGFKPVLKHLLIGIFKFSVRIAFETFIIYFLIKSILNG